MLDKVKRFYKKHEVAVWTIGGTVALLSVGILLGKKLYPEPIITDVGEPMLNNVDREVLEGFGAIFKEGYDVPFATKEVALKFMEERGNDYQIDILDDLTSVIWISNP